MLHDLLCELVDLWDQNDVATCVCGIAGVLDIIPGLTLMPGVENLDCVCNLLTAFQLHCEKRTCESRWYFAITVSDCASLPLGSFLGGLLGLPTGPAGGLLGVGLGTVIGDAVVDIIMFMLHELHNARWCVSQ